MRQEKEGSWDSASSEAVWDIPQNRSLWGKGLGIYPPIRIPHRSRVPLWVLLLLFLRVGHACRGVVSS